MQNHDGPLPPWVFVVIRCTKSVVGIYKIAFSLLCKISIEYDVV